MKKFTHLKLLIVSFLFLGMYSCAPKYGAHFSSSSNFYEPKEQEEAVTIPHEVAAIIIENQNNEVTPGGERMVASRKIIPVVPNKSIQKLVGKHQVHVEELERATLDSKAKERELRKETKRAKKEIKKQIKKEIKNIEAQKQDDDRYVLMMVLAVIIPPLAVGLTYGIIDKFWISLLLTLLFWLPGAIYSLIVVNNYYK